MEGSGHGDAGLACCAVVSVVGGVYAMWPTFCQSVCVNKVVGRLFVSQFVYCHQHSQTNTHAKRLPKAFPFSAIVWLTLYILCTRAGYASVSASASVAVSAPQTFFCWAFVIGMIMLIDG